MNNELRFPPPHILVLIRDAGRLLLSGCELTFWLLKIEIATVPDNLTALGYRRLRVND